MTALAARFAALADAAASTPCSSARAAAQRDEALALALARGWSVEVVGVAHAREAVARAFPEARSKPPPGVTATSPARRTPWTRCSRCAAATTASPTGAR